MGWLRKTQACNEGQQAAIGHGARIVDFRRLTAECKGHGAGTRAAGEVVHGIPGRHQGQPQQGCKGQAACHVCGYHVAKGLDGPCAQPVGQQALGVRVQAQDGRR
ncbi:hypothetical protein D3C71_1805390 [compost metagenome]